MIIIVGHPRESQRGGGIRPELALLALRWMGLVPARGNVSAFLGGLGKGEAYRRADNHTTSPHIPRLCNSTSLTGVIWLLSEFSLPAKTLM